MHLAAAHSLLGCIIRKMRSQLNAEERRTVVLSEVEAVAAGGNARGNDSQVWLVEWEAHHWQAGTQSVTSGKAGYISRSEA